LDAIGEDLHELAGFCRWRGKYNDVDLLAQDEYRDISEQTVQEPGTAQQKNQ
jgi:hypothetical protein